jgi:hypothetical protein
MAAPYVEALAKIMTLVDLETFLKTCQTPTVFNIEPLIHNIRRDPPADLIYRKASLEETLTSTHLDGLPIINCVYDGSLAVCRNESRFFLTKDLLKWLDRIAAEKTGDGQPRLSRDRDLAMRIAGGLRAFGGHAAQQLLVLAVQRMESLRNDVEELTEEVDASEREVADLEAESRIARDEMNRLARKRKRPPVAVVRSLE